MVSAKKHLEKIYRIHPDDSNRRNAHLRLDMNEGYPGLPQEFIEKVLCAVGSEFVATYPTYEPLIEKIARINNLQPSNICLSNGSDSAIKLIFDSYVNPDDVVLLTDPTFAMYPIYSELYQAKVDKVSYLDDLSFDFERFYENLNNTIKVAVIVNPNNPTGSIISREQLIRLIEKAKSCNTLFVVDEAYYYFYEESIIDLVNIYDNLVVLRTFSKLTGMAALRLGFAAGSDRIIENMSKVKPTFDVNSIAVLFAENLLDEPELLTELVANFRYAKEYLITNLERDFEIVPGYANFILIRCDGRVEDIINKLKNIGIYISGNFSQSYLKDYIRVSIGSIKMMEEFIASFRKVWDEI